MAHYKQPIQKKKTDKNKRIIAYVLLCFFAFWTISSILTIFLSVKDCKTAKADSTTTYYRFEGSNVLMPSFYNNINYLYSSSNVEEWGNITTIIYNSIDNFKFIFDSGRFSSYNWNLTLNTTSNNYVFNSYVYFIETWQLRNTFDLQVLSYKEDGILNCNSSNPWHFVPANFETYDFDGNIYSFNVNTGLTLEPSILSQQDIGDYNNIDHTSWYYLLRFTQGGTTQGSFLGFKSSRDFDGRVAKVLYIPVVAQFDSNKVVLCNCLSYVDFNNNTSTFYFPLAFGVLNETFTLSYWNNYLNNFIVDGVDPSHLTKFYGLLTPRTYYTELYVSYASQNADYDLGYSNGLSEGRLQQQPEIYQNGYDNGYVVGRSVGYDNGYEQGAYDSEHYTFLSLMGSVVDAPIQAITGLLNFDILGFNLLNLFFGLCTLALIIFVVRLFIGGK